MTKVALPRIGEWESIYQNPYYEIYRAKADFGQFVKEYFVVDSGVRAGILVV